MHKENERLCITSWFRKCIGSLISVHDLLTTYDVVTSFMFNFYPELTGKQEKPFINIEQRSGGCPCQTTCTFRVFVRRRQLYVTEMDIKEEPLKP